MFLLPQKDKSFKFIFVLLVAVDSAAGELVRLPILLRTCKIMSNIRKPYKPLLQCLDIL